MQYKLLEDFTMNNKWREHPDLRGLFHPDYPDDLQVIVHDGGPRISSNQQEGIWVTVTGMNAKVLQGRVLNKPNKLRNIHQGSEIKFIIVKLRLAVAGRTTLPVMITDKYIQERTEWDVMPCSKCGFSDLFDAPSDLLRVNFPDQLLMREKFPVTGEKTELFSFTSSCPLCRDGKQMVLEKSTPSPLF
jgi:hypothetical protein